VSSTVSITIAALHIYPVKSCKGIALSRAQLIATGLHGDRQWMIVNDNGRFCSQREMPRLSIIECTMSASGIRLAAPGMEAIDVSASGEQRPVTVWRDTVNAIDAGDEVARHLTAFLGTPVRLVCMHPHTRRASDRNWTGDIEALNAFSDGFPLLAISEASLSELNDRLIANGSKALPMNRFRPNLVLRGLDAYAEDSVDELIGDGVRLRVVKPCTRCKIPTVDQSTGMTTGDEPLTTLKSYRWNAQLHGVTFGQNVIIAAGVGATLKVGQVLEAKFKP
jgi:uncharacterized protein YcbX